MTRSGAILAGLAAAAALAYTASLAWGIAGLGLVAKPVPVLVLAAWVRAPGRYARFVALGLLFSALGDVLLELPRGFLPGLGAFLVAHLTYALAFLLDTRRLAPLRALPFLLWTTAARIALGPGLDGMAGAVTAYSAAIATMMWRAAARVGSKGAATRGEWAGVLGAVLFGGSDTLIAFDRFAAPIPGVRYPIILLYWLGQLGIALSALWREPPLHSSGGGTAPGSRNAFTSSSRTGREKP